MSSFFRANVTLTDLPEAVPLTELNLKENLEICTSDNNTVQVVSLIWGEDVFTNIIPDVILLADCIYYKEVSKKWKVLMVYTLLLILTFCCDLVNIV